MLIQTVKSVKIYNTCTCIHFESKPRYRSNYFNCLLAVIQPSDPSFC